MIPCANKILLGVMCVVFCQLQGCLTFRTKPENIDRLLKSSNVKGGVHSYNVDWRTMQYAQAGDSTKPIVVFVHGSPGSLSAFTHFLCDSSLLANAFLISADRPGFGYSNFGNAEASLQKQGFILKQLLDKKGNGHPLVLVGHSLGGPLIAKMAIDYPEIIDGIVIVAGSIDPELEPNETWFRAPLASPFLSFLLPRSFRASNEELYHLKPELEMMIPEWKKVTCPVVVIHGRKDQFVPFKNIEFAKTMLTNTTVDFILNDSANHFIDWSNPELINEGIMLMLQKAQQFKTARKSVIH